MKILFLDDRAVRRETFRTKYPNAVFVETVVDCIQILKVQLFDLVSMDYDLTQADPEHTGLEVAEWIAKYRQPPMMRFIIVHSTNLVGALPMLEVLRGAGYNPLYLPFTFEPCGPFNL